MTRLLLYVWVLCLPWMAAAQPTTLLDDKDHTLTIGHQTEILEDPKGTLRLQDAQASKDWVLSEQGVINKGFNLSTWWFRFTLKNTTSEKRTWLVTMGWPILTEVDFYDGQKAYETGESRPFDNRPVDHRDFTFPITLEPGQSQTYYMRAFSKAPGIYPITVSTHQSFDDDNLLDMLLLALYLGAVVIMVIYNTLLYLSVRDRSYIPYIFYLLSSVVFILSFRGLGYQYIWKDITWINVFTRVGLAAFSMLCLATFARMFLHTKERAPRHHMALRIVQILAVVVMAAMLLQDVVIVYFAGDILLNLLVGALPFISLLTALKVYRQGYRPAKYYLLAFSVFLPGLVIQILKNLGVLEQNLFTEYSFQFGIVLEQAILSLALGDRINVIKDEKEAAQAEAIEALKENEKLIAEQNRVLEYKVAERTEELKATLELVEQKNEDIIESIRYAKRIQTAILPDSAYIRQHLPSSFVFYRPKDIVSGDFYWFAHREGRTLLAAVDCTGHGVPGAFMSVIGYNLLNRIVLEERIHDPGTILTRLDQGVRMALKQDGSSKSQDGMDLVLCVIDHSAGTVHTSAAQRPVLILRGEELIEVKGDKYPIGGSFYDDKQFTTQQLDLQPGDRIYLTTDGYADQFGGDRGRKMGTRQFKDKLVELRSVPLVDQAPSFEQFYDEWKGNYEQIDDVTLIGFSI